VSITSEALARLEAVSKPLMAMSEGAIEAAVDSGDCLKDPHFLAEVEGDFGYFYAPFDWVNDTADIVLIGITPGRQQAKKALMTLRAALLAGRGDTAAAEAKQAASFEGDMRNIASSLMNRFNMNKLFGFEDCAELFGSSSSRVHYTSILRYPVFHRRQGKWTNYSGTPNPFSVDFLRRHFEHSFAKEVSFLGRAWLVPFGPVPAAALARLVEAGVVNADRVLDGLNHPSGTQWNRHKCQLNTTEDHSGCQPNVGCEKLRARSLALETRVSEHLQRPER
jgi:hypothetical protein